MLFHHHHNHHHMSYSFLTARYYVISRSRCQSTHMEAPLIFKPFQIIQLSIFGNHFTQFGNLTIRQAYYTFKKFLILTLFVLLLIFFFRFSLAFLVFVGSIGEMKLNLKINNKRDLVSEPCAICFARCRFLIKKRKNKTLTIQVNIVHRSLSLSLSPTPPQKRVCKSVSTK